MRDTLFKKHISALKRGRRSYDLLDTGWRSGIPRNGGVYVIWEGVDAVYVGESANLYERFGDLERTVNHTFRRKIRKADSRLSETGISKRISDSYQISFVVLKSGRKELEEYLICRWSTESMNKTPSRYMRSDDYEFDA